MIENLPKRLVLLAALLGGLRSALRLRPGPTRTTRRTAPPPPSSCCSAPGARGTEQRVREHRGTTSAHCTTTRPAPRS